MIHVKSSIVVLWKVHLAVAMICALERNRHNPLAYVLKVMRNGTFVCHGALITPKLVFTPKTPFEGLNKTGSNLVKFIATKYRWRGVKACDVERQITERDRRLVYENLNISCWRLAEEIPTMSSDPFVWFKHADLADRTGVKQAIANMQDGGIYQACTLPVYDSRSPSASVKVEVVKIVVNPLVAVWVKRHWDIGGGVTPHCCKNYRQFFGYFDTDEPRDWTYYGGAVLSCFGKPVGLFSTVVDGEPTKRAIDATSIKQVILFDSLEPTMKEAGHNAKNEWIDPSTTCILDRDRYNQLPYVLKILRKNKTVGHAVLITPKFVLTTRSPYEEILYNPPLSAELTMMATRYKDINVKMCDSYRNMEGAVFSWSGPWNQDTAFWEFKEAYVVTTRHPYPWIKLSQLPNISIRDEKLNTFEKSGIFEPCTLPVFASTDQQALIKVETVNILTGSAVVEWTNNACNTVGKGDQNCRSSAIWKKFFGYLESEEPSDWSWYRGAVVSCWGEPIGMFSTVIGSANFKGKTSRKIMLFENFIYARSIWKARAEKEWLGF